MDRKELMKEIDQVLEISEAEDWLTLPIRRSVVILRETRRMLEGQRWISVEEGLPEENESMFARFHATEKWDRTMWKNESETVLVSVLFPDGGIKVTVGRLHDGKWNTSVSKLLPHEVTHWMPLPEPPEVGEG